MHAYGTVTNWHGEVDMVSERSELMRIYRITYTGILKMAGGKRCSLGFCKSQEGKDKTISFFSFPKDIRRRNVWIQKCNRTDKINPDYARICSLHFLPTDFERNLKAELLNLPARKKLKPDAVPSQLLKSEDTAVPITPRDDRTAKREGKRLVHRLVTLAEESCTSQLETKIIQDESTNKALLNYEIDKLNNEVNQLKKENEKLKSILQETTIKHGCDMRELENTIEKMQEIVKSRKEEEDKCFNNKIKNIFAKQFTQNQLDLIMKKEKKT
ncbi:hypothetical protein NQ317_016198 [Molorchus minor]|uniref:THAP-type domain-containing protein n=1 Tax=Molorchus minor TaxID=1323400 RepID=A0ABQ9J7C9_9CUCU|nr:hypothetical protein NQ317_016198 [Molorchus minor]